MRLASCLVMAGAALMGCITDNHNSEPLNFLNPELGATQTYAGYRVGADLRGPDTMKTYTQDRLTITVKTLEPDIIILSEKTCLVEYPPCLTRDIRLSAKDGNIFETEVDFTRHLLDGINAFPRGLLSADSTRPIPFFAHHPEVASGPPQVGYADHFAIRGRDYGKVTVLADPANIPVDGGGLCFIIGPDKRVLQVFHYGTLGWDGGWEIAD